MARLRRALGVGGGAGGFPARAPTRRIRSCGRATPSTFSSCSRSGAGVNRARCGGRVGRCSSWPFPADARHAGGGDCRHAQGIDGDTIAVFWVAPLLILTFARTSFSASARRQACGSRGVALSPGPSDCDTGAATLRVVCRLPAVMARSFSLYVVMTRSLRSESTRAEPLLHRAWRVRRADADHAAPLDHADAARSSWYSARSGCSAFGGLYALDRMASLPPVSSRRRSSAFSSCSRSARRDVADHHVPGRLA